MDQIRIVDTTLRDGNQSMWAGRMRAEAMLPAMEDIDAAGYDGVEFAVPTVQFPRAVRDLQENPWDWLKLGSARASRTQLRLHGSVTTRFHDVPLALSEMMLDRMFDLGIRTTRTSNCWNDMEKMRGTLDLVSRHGLQLVANIVYAVSPRHTGEYYAQKVRDAVALKPHRICFKDVGGLLTPETARELVPVVLGNAGDVEVELHVHCSNGLGPYVALIAAECGIRIIHTAIPPLANGGSQPSVFTVVENLRARGFKVDLDLKRLERVRDHFTRVADVEGYPKGQVREFHVGHYAHQVPGGMVSNLEFQLGKLGAVHRLEETLAEAARVREDLGYPIMVTPLAQFVGSQAALNVITGERYAAVSDDVILYALGAQGSEAVDVMDPSVREQILDRPRAAELASAARSPATSLDEVRSRFAENISDDELMMRVMANVGPEPLDLRPAPPEGWSYEDYAAMYDPSVAMVRALSTARRVKQFNLTTPTMQFSGHRR